MCAWCHGATGIGLGRLGALDISCSEHTMTDIENAIIATQNRSFTSVDHLCCGNAGSLELFLTAAKTLNRPDLHQHAEKLAALMVNHKKNRGGFSTPSSMDGDVYCPGFFTGTAGIGYTLLRLAAPDKIPPVLLWV